MLNYWPYLTNAKVVMASGRAFPTDSIVNPKYVLSRFDIIPNVYKESINISVAK